MVARTPRMSQAAKTWREAWLGADYEGDVVIATDPGSGEEMLMIECREVVAKFGERPCIVDDGRTVGICVDDRVAFGVVRRPGRPPIAMNVYRLPAAKRRKGEGKGKAGGKGAAGSKGVHVMPTELPESLAGDLCGVIRNQSIATGDFYIACPEVYDLYKKDPKIPVQDMPSGVAIGDPISFCLQHPENERAYPIAIAVQRKAGTEADTIYAKTYPWKGGKGKGGKGKAKGAKFAPGGPRSDQVMRMVGIVKHKNPITGRHFVLCQDLSDVYGKDPQIPEEELPEGGVRVGDRIVFDADEPKAGQRGFAPLVRNVRVVNSAGAKKQVAEGDGVDEGDGEPEEEVEVEEEEEPEVDEEEKDEGFDGEELQDADEEARLQAAQAAEAEAEEEEEPKEALPAKNQPPAEPEEDAGRRFALTWQKASEAGKSGVVTTSAALKAPETPEEWAAQQSKLFAGLPPLRRGWIRIRSKSKGLVYYYNMESGDSCTEEPRR